MVRSPTIGLVPTTSRRLSRQSIIDFAIEIADADGYTAVTLANVAARAGCKAPSLYNHVEGLDDMLDELCLAATADFASALRDSVVAKVGADAVRSYAHTWRDYVLTKPGRYEATLRPLPHRPAERSAVTAGMTVPAGSILTTLGIADHKLDDAGRALRSGLHGFAHLEMTSSIGPNTTESFESVIDVLIAGLQAMATE